MDFEREYVNSVVKHIFKSKHSSSILYTALLHTEDPTHTVRWQLSKNQKTNETSCQAIHTHFNDDLNLDSAPEDLPKEYFDLIEQKYLEQAK